MSTVWFLQNFTNVKYRPAIMINFKYANKAGSFEKISTNELSFTKGSDYINLTFSDRQKQLLLNGGVVTENVILRSSKTQKTQRFKITAIYR